MSIIEKLESLAKSYKSLYSQKNVLSGRSKLERKYGVKIPSSTSLTSFKKSAQFKRLKQKKKTNN